MTPEFERRARAVTREFYQRLEACTSAEEVVRLLKEFEERKQRRLWPKNPTIYQAAARQTPHLDRSFWEEIQHDREAWRELLQNPALDARRAEELLLFGLERMRTRLRDDFILSFWRGFLKDLLALGLVMERSAAAERLRRMALYRATPRQEMLQDASAEVYLSLPSLSPARLLRFAEQVHVFSSGAQVLVHRPEATPEMWRTLIRRFRRNWRLVNEIALSPRALEACPEARELTREQARENSHVLRSWIGAARGEEFQRAVDEVREGWEHHLVEVLAELPADPGRVLRKHQLQRLLSHEDSRIRLLALSASRHLAGAQGISPSASQPAPLPGHSRAG